MLNKAIESILAQTFTDYEILLIDDGSKDGTVEKMRSYALPLVPSSLAGLLAAQMGTLVLKYFYSGDPEYNEQVAGIFSAAIKLAL